MAADHLAALERRELLSEQRLVAGLAVGHAQLDITSLAEQAREAVRARRLREEIELVHVAVGAGPLGARADGQQQPIAQTQPLLLSVKTDGPLVGELLERRQYGALVDVLLARQQPVRLHSRTVELTVLPLHARGRGGLEARRRVRVDRVQVPVREPAVRVSHRGHARVRLVRLEIQLPRRHTLFLWLKKSIPPAATIFRLVLALAIAWYVAVRPPVNRTALSSFWARATVCNGFEPL